MCCGVRVGDHAADVLSDHVNWRLNAEMVVVDQLVMVVCYGDLVVPIFEMGGLACTAIVGRDHTVAPTGQGSDDMPPLLRGVWKAVDEQDDAFVARQIWRADNVMDPYFLFVI